MSRKKWVVSDCNKDIAASLAENCGVDPFAAFLLCARGMTDEFEIESFLYDADLIDPYELPDMEKAVERILIAIENGERVTVFGDFDADGVTSTALLYLYLSSKNASVDYYIPNRSGEGYGMNKNAIDILKERGTGLIITVDNGISAVEEIDYANSLGIDVVVTDHHRVGEELPKAVAVVDPHRKDSLCGFSEWAGVGVAFKLICAIEGNEGYELLEEYGDIVALGTVADIVPLKGENRVIVRSGLAFINAALSDGSLRKGIKALIDVSAAGDSLDSSGLAFRLAPRINAAGRMGSAEDALKLLLCDDKDEASALAEKISGANAERQSIEAKITESAVEYIESNPRIKYSRVLVVEGEEWHQGVIGIVASRLVEKYGKPCIVVSKNGESAKGSGRSIEGFSLYDAFSYCADILTQFGGHTLAAGMSIESSNIQFFREKINEYAEKFETPVPVLKIDCKLNPASLSLDILNSIELLEPFGAENHQPLFGLFNMELVGIQSVGAGKHIRLGLRRKNNTISAILFSVAIEAFEYKIGDFVDIAVKIGSNEYQGRQQLSIQVKAIRFSGTDDGKVIDSLQNYEEFCSKAVISYELKEKIAIDRDFCVSIYKFIKANGGWDYTEEALTKRLGLSEEKIASCKIALDVLTDLGLIKYENSKYALPSQAAKTALENSKIFVKASK